MATAIGGAVAGLVAYALLPGVPLWRVGLVALLVGWTAMLATAIDEARASRK